MDFIVHLALSLNDVVCVSTDIDGTYWIGYLGEIVLTEEEYEYFLNKDDQKKKSLMFNNYHN